MLCGRLAVVAGDPGKVDDNPPPQERPLRPGGSQSSSLGVATQIRPCEREGLIARRVDGVSWHR